MMSLLSISWRSIWRRKRRTLITTSAITFGLVFALWTAALSNGTREQMVDHAVRTNGGHFTLEHPDYRDEPAIDLVVHNVSNLREQLGALDGVAQTKILVLGQAVVKTGSAAVGVAVLGIEPAAEIGVSPLARNIKQGAYLEPTDGPKIVIGKNLAKRLEVAPGKKLVIAGTDIAGNLTEELARVKGVFRVGAAEIDGYVVQIPIDFARALYGLGPEDATQVGAILDDPGRRDAIMTAFCERVPDQVSLLSWSGPALILADEPTANVDSATGAALLDLMTELNESQGVTFLFSSHDPMVIKRSRQLIVLKDGVIEYDGDPENKPQDN